MPNVQHNTSPHPSDTSSNESHESPPAQSSAAIVRTANKPQSRRGHFKSRLGCFNCKRRRVKCNEMRPSCSPCSRLGLSCAYPTPPTASSGPRATLSPLALDDLRFYHQFLMAAFPTLPLRANDVWNQAAAMSHNYESLAHAVLALGASHLSQHGNVDYTSQALQHRVAAIKLVNEQLDKPPKSPTDADALFATVLCLLSQSSLMPDSMIEYLTMTRGGNLIVTTIIPDMETTSIFKGLALDGHVSTLSEIVCDQPKDYALFEDFRLSLMKLEPLCQNPNELMYWGALYKCITSLPTSCFEAWMEYINIYMIPTALSNDDYTAFVHPENHVGHLLIIHMFLLDYILGKSCIGMSDMPKFPGRKNNIILWARNLAESLPAKYQQYMEWPLQYCEVLVHQDARYLFSP